jgi:beta-galactosidase
MSSSLTRSFASLFCSFVLSVALLKAQPVEVAPAQDATLRLSLDGSWRFRYQAGPTPAETDFVTPGFDDQAWASITVPGHWELQGFAAPKYSTELAAGTGFYRRSFRVPGAWAGQRIMLRFDGVLYGFDAWVNGAPVGAWASGYNAVTFDVTDHVKPGSDNVLAVRVTTRSHGWEFDTNDCWSLSGIYREVTLFAVPAIHLTHHTARTQLNADGSATLDIGVETSGPGANVRGRLRAPDGALAGEFSLSPAPHGIVPDVRTLTIQAPKLWTAETPFLYTLELTLTAPGQPDQSFTEKIGLRQVTIVNSTLLLNGRPIKLRGVDHHDLWPDTGRATDETKMRRDLALIQSANCNFIRTSHYPPHPRLLELCDELGLYVMDEVPFGFGEEHLKDEAYREDLLTRAQATVRRDENHACVLVWSVGNENDNTPLTFATARRVKELDPTRPVCFPQIGGYFANSYSELPPDIDIYAPHYPSTATVQDYANRLTRPIIFTEYAHALGLATDQVQAQWAIMQASPRIAGGAIWMFQDQGILRRAGPGETPASSHDLGLNVWPDAEHYYDSHGNQGMDGIVYSDRTPQVDYWQVRKVYSPVQISAGDLALQAGVNRFQLALENRFDFRSLDGFILEWALVSNGRKIQSGSLPLHTAARTSATVTIEATIREAMASDDFNWLELRCLSEKGISIYEDGIRLKSNATAGSAAKLTSRLVPGKLSLVENADSCTVRHPAFTLSLNRVTGGITLRDAGGRELAAGFAPHVGRRFTEGEFMRSRKELTWTDAPLRPAAKPETSATQMPDGIALRVRGQYSRSDAPEQSLEGETNLLVRANGTIEVRYDYVPVNGRGLLLEAGLELRTPAAASEFQWIGAGPFPGYPGKDALNEFGRHHLNRDDLNFSGNRREVELAALTAPRGSGVLVLPEKPADVAVERSEGGTVLSHNALLSGRGTKFAEPDTFIRAESAPRIAGRFTLLPLTARWPEPLIRWLGAPTAATPFRPYFHSYDR